MDEQALWNVFESTGRVEDYLRYRAFTPVTGEGSDHGSHQTASDDRRSDHP